VSEAEGDEILRRRIKEEIRRQMRAVRRAIPAEARAARSAAIVAQLLALPEVAEARVVLAYMPMKGEPDLGAVVAAARAAGKTIALTRVDPESGDLTLHEHAEGATLETSALGFGQPAAGAPAIEAARADLVLVPAIAYDERGNRIGMGKGYYDALLPDLSNARRIGVIFDFQLIAEVPVTPGDQPVHLVVTDRRTIRVGE
jgi:5-formyltetrahydrofolate cyclo-ligase